MKRTLAAVLVISAAACATQEPPDGYGLGLGTPENPIPNDDVTYAVASRIDFAGDASLPPRVEAAVTRMRAFAVDPARTLIALLEAADAPALAQLQRGLDPTLAPRLEGWINAELDKVMISGKTVRQYAGQVAGYVETSLTEFRLDSTLAFSPKVTQRLNALNFRPAGLDIVVPVGGLTAEIVTQHPTLDVAEAGLITFGDQRFGVVFGDHAWHGVNLANTALFGGGVRATFGSGVGCAALAQAVSSKCVDGACVGHRSELTAMCETSLDLLVDELKQHVGAFKLDVLRFMSGSARLVDDNADGLAERIVEGVWDSDMDIVGWGPASATFTASRQEL